MAYTSEERVEGVTNKPGTMIKSYLGSFVLTDLAFFVFLSPFGRFVNSFVDRSDVSGSRFSPERER